MTNKDFVKRLKHLATQRQTFYDNSFPGNCGLIHTGGSISFDCIGLVKSVINEPDIAYKMTPAGYYVTPGQVIGDWSEIQILNNCSGVVWGDFSGCIEGDYLYMSGHGGVFIGDCGDVNVVECTGSWRGGVLCSWVDEDGTRRSHKGGAANGKWEAHGRLMKFIEYPKDGWYVEDGVWYHTTARGWFFDPSYKRWFYIEENGKMHIGWLCDKGKWYFLADHNDGKHVLGEMITGDYRAMSHFDGHGVWKL